MLPCSGKEKYEADGRHSLLPQISDAERGLIEREIQTNIAGMLKGRLGLGGDNQSSAAEGAAIGETYLETLIKVHEPEVTRVTRYAEFPFRIRWDYCGVAAANTGLNRTATVLSHVCAG